MARIDEDFGNSYKTTYQGYLEHNAIQNEGSNAKDIFIKIALKNAISSSNSNQNEKNMDCIQLNVFTTVLYTCTWERK